MTCWREVVRDAERNGRSAAATVADWPPISRSSVLSSMRKPPETNKILERVGETQGAYPKARGFVQIAVTATKTAPAEGAGPPRQRAKLTTEIRKPDLRRPRSSPKARRMTPQVILRDCGSSRSAIS